MTPDRLQQIEELYHLVRESSADRRAALLAQADPEVRSKVESLLARQHESLPALDLRAMAVTHPGTRLGPYQVESKLGEGGMGEVFRAVDIRLGRPVAIKIVDEQFSGAVRARGASDLFAQSSPHLYSLRYRSQLSGNGVARRARPSRRRLKSGPLQVDDALRYAGQIAAALAEAHRAGLFIAI